MGVVDPVAEAAGAVADADAETEVLAVELPVAAAWNAAKLLPGLTGRKMCLRCEKP